MILEYTHLLDLNIKPRSQFKRVAAAVESASAYEHKPSRRIRRLSYFKALPQIEQLPLLNQPYEWSEFFFSCGGTIIDQRSLHVGHIFNLTLLITSTNLEHLTQS